MADISSKLDKIKSAERGEDVRDAIIGALRDINNDVPADMSNPERVTADMPGNSDLTIPFNPPKLVSEIYVRQAGSGGKSTTLKDITITENGEYPTDEEDYDSSTENRYYKKVKVDVPQLANKIEMDEVVIEQNGTYSATEWGVDGLRTITVNVQGAAGDGPFQVEFYDKVQTDPTAAVIYTELVPKGGTAEFHGTTPTSEIGPLLGWNPSPVNVTRDLKCYPKFGQIVIDPTEISDDWTVICANGGQSYPLGSHKLLAYGATFTADEVRTWYPGYTGRNVQFNIYMMMYKVAEGEGNSHSSWLSSKIVVDSINIILPHSGYGGWTVENASSSLRKFLNGAFFNHMADIFKNAIVPVIKYSIDRNGIAVPTEDRVWAPGISEIGTYKTRPGENYNWDFTNDWSDTSSYMKLLEKTDSISKKYVRDYLNNDRNFDIAFLYDYRGTSGLGFQRYSYLRDTDNRSYPYTFRNNTAIELNVQTAIDDFNIGFCL